MLYRFQRENLGLAHIFIEIYILDNHGKRHNPDDNLDRRI